MPNLSWLYLLAAIALAGFATPAATQVVPDATLGNGNNSSTLINGIRTDINGGLRRGSALFHSFERFGILTNHQVYFANPAGIRNIFSRVTGGSISNIDGLLGVSGGANLFFMNPNGIIFGPNARLDVSGSFFATTANTINFPDGQKFAADGDRTVPLVEVNIPIGLQYGANPPAMLTNRGILATGQDLTLASNNLDLQGQLQAGGNLTLNATDTVKIRDTVTEPFVARSGGDMLIQGNQGIDILALNHLSQTPFVSGGNIGLVSNGVISTDAHFTGDGDFTIRTLRGEIGNFVSLHDPIITMGGNFNVGNYTGASLQVNAGGDIAYGNVVINALDAAIDPIRPAFILGSGGTITANGNVSTTLVGIPLRVEFTAVGDINLTSPDPTAPRQIIATGNTATGFGIIQLNSTGGSVILNRASLTTSNSNPNGEAGDIFLSAARNVEMTDSNIESDGIFGRIFVGRTTAFGTPTGERVIINRSSLTATNNLNGTTNRTGGLIDINVPGNANIPATLAITDSSLQTTSTNQAQGGEINLTVGNGRSIEIDNSFIDASISGLGGTGFRNPGVRVRAVDGTVTVRNNSLVTTAVDAGTAATAVAGPIDITAGNVSLTGGSALNATTAGNAPGGNIAINANSVTVNQSSQINASVQSTGSATANGGDITITTNTFALDQGGRVQARTFGAGAAGDIQLTFTDTATIANFDPQSLLYSGILTDTLGSGAGGNITINSLANRVGTLTLQNGGFLSARTASLSSAAVPGGNIAINVNNLNILSGGQVLTTSSSFGNAGNITVNAVGNVTVSGSRTTLPVVNSSFTNPTTFTILELDGQIPNNPTPNPLVEQSDVIPFISLQRNPTGQPGSIFATPNAAGNAAGGTNLGAAANFDYYGFTVTQDGSRAIFDIDNNVSDPAAPVIADTQVFLFDAQTGQLLVSNDDFFPANAGSISGRDSRLAFNFNSAGRYVLGVGQFPTTAANNTPLAGTPMAAANAYRLQVSVQNSLQTPGTGVFSLSDRNSNQGLNSGLFSNVQPEIANRAAGGTGIGGNIAVTSQSGQITLSDRALVNANTAGLGQGGNVLLQTGIGGVSVTGGARVETRTTGVGNVTAFGGNAGNIVINAPDIIVSGSAPFNGQPLFSGLLASSDTAKSGQGGSIIINNAAGGAVTGNSLLVENGAFLSTLNRSDQEGRGIEVNVNRLQLLDGGQVITAAEGRGAAGNITINSPDVTISGTSSSTFPNNIAGGRFSLASQVAIDFSTIVPHQTVTGNNGQVNYYSFDIPSTGNRAVFDIDNANSGFNDTELFLFRYDAAANQSFLLARNDDSRPEGQERGSTNIRDSYLDYQFDRPGTYILAVAPYSGGTTIIPGNPNQPTLGQPIVTPTFLSPAQQYTLQISIDQRNTLNPNQSPNQIASSGLFAQSNAVGGGAGNITVNGNGSGQVTLNNGAQISGSTVSGQGNGINLVGLNNLQVTDSLISASTTGNGGVAGNVTINAASSVELNGSLSNGVGGVSTQAINGNGSAGSITIVTRQLQSRNNADIVASTNAGSGGSIILSGLNDLQLDNSQISASTQTGRAGSLNVNAVNSVTLNNGSALSVAAAGSGNAGAVSLTTQQLTINNSEISATTTSGVGGDVTLQGLNTLQMNSGQVIASTETGRAGNLSVDASNAIALNNNSSLSVEAMGQTGNSGNVTLTTPQLSVNNSQISASTVGGVGGNVTLQGLNSLQMNNGQVIASTETGQAGDLNVNVSGDINLTNNSRLAVEATGANGVAGDITINGQNITLQNSEVLASSRQGRSGNIRITGRRLDLQNGTIKAETGQSTGARSGSIDLDLSFRLTLEDESEISTLGLNGADGGDITILNVRFLFGKSPTGSNGSDIVGRADGGGRGGRVFLDRKTLVQGFSFRRAEPGNRTNDIDTNGQLANFSTDADVGARGLSTTLIVFNDVSQIVRSACEAAGANTETNTELKISGRGGVPISPTVSLSAKDTTSDWVFLELSPQVSVGITLPDGTSETLQPGQIYHLQATCVNGWKGQQRSLL